MYTPLSEWRGPLPPAGPPPAGVRLPPGAAVLSPPPMMSSGYRMHERDPRLSAYPPPPPPVGYPPIPYVYGGYSAAQAHYQSPEEYARRKSKKSRSSSGKKNKKSALNEWTDWRTSINNNLSEDILRNSYHDIPVGDEFERLSRGSSRAGRSVYHYSTAIDQATGLAKDDYINFGIPRATASTAGVREKVRTTSDSESDSEKPFYSIHKLNGFSEDQHGRQQRQHHEEYPSQEARHRNHERRPPTPPRHSNNRYFASPR